MYGNRIRKDQMTNSETLLKEAQPMMTGQPRVWARQFGTQVTFGETFGKMLTARIPLKSSNLRIDTRVFHDIPTALGLVHAVQNYTGKGLLPTEFLITLNGHIPRPAYIKRARMHSAWVTAGYEDATTDDFKQFLDGIRCIVNGKQSVLSDHGQQFTFSLGNSSLELPYTMQLIQLPNAKYVFAFNRPFQAGLWSRKQVVYHISEFMGLAGCIQSAIFQMNFPQQSASAPSIAIPTLSLLAIPEIGPHLSDQGFELLI